MILSNDTGFLMTGWRCQAYGEGGCENNIRDGETEG